MYVRFDVKRVYGVSFGVKRVYGACSNLVICIDLYIKMRPIIFNICFEKVPSYAQTHIVKLKSGLFICHTIDNTFGSEPND